MYAFLCLCWLSIGPSVLGTLANADVVDGKVGGGIIQGVIIFSGKKMCGLFEGGVIRGLIYSKFYRKYILVKKCILELCLDLANIRFISGRKLRIKCNIESHLLVFTHFYVLSLDQRSHEKSEYE